MSEKPSPLRQRMIETHERAQFRRDDAHTGIQLERLTGIILNKCSRVLTLAERPPAVRQTPQRSNFLPAQERLTEERRYQIIDK
jgi:hypothetical protein